MQYLVLYVLGLLKSPVLSPTKQVQANDALESMSYLRFILNSMSPEETLPIFHPQIICVSNPDLNDQEFPQVSLRCPPRVLPL